MSRQAPVEWIRKQGEAVGEDLVGLAPLVPRTGGVLQEGDVSYLLLSIKCHCGKQIGEVWFHDRAHRAEAGLYSATVQVCRDRDARPVDMQAVEMLISQDDVVRADCEVHGMQVAVGGEVIKAARRSYGRVARADSSPHPEPGGSAPLDHVGALPVFQIPARGGVS